MKWFTYCHAPEKHGLTTYDRERTMGLVFGTDNEEELTMRDLMALAEEPGMQAIFPGGFFLNLEHGRIIASGDLRFIEFRPDLAKANDPPILMSVGGKLHRYDRRDRYDSCRFLIKAVGCDHCPEFGEKCIGRAFSHLADTERPRETRYLEKDLAEMLQHRKTKLGEFIYASPVMTTDKMREGTLRPAAEHDFAEIEHASIMRSKNSKAAAVSRDFKQNNCKTCPIQGPCGKWTYHRCEGRYADEPALNAKVFEYWEKYMKPKLPWPEWQFWALAAGGGNTTKYRRMDVVFSGPSFIQGTWRIEIQRRRRPAGHLTYLKSYEAAAELFELPKTEEETKASEYWQAPQNETRRALYLMTTMMAQGNAHSTRFDGIIEDEVIWTSFDRYDVKVCFGRTSGLKPVKEIHTYAQFFAYFGEFPFGLPQIEYVRLNQRSQGKQLELLPELTTQQQ